MILSGLDMHDNWYIGCT